MKNGNISKSFKSKMIYYFETLQVSQKFKSFVAPEIIKIKDLDRDD